MRTMLSLFLLASCSSPEPRQRRAPTPASASPTAPAPTPAPAPAPADVATIEGAWSLQELGGPASFPGGIAIVGEHVEVLVTSVDRDPILASRGLAPDAAWTDGPVLSGRAASGWLAPPATAFLVPAPDDPTMTRLEYVLRGRRETICANADPVFADLVSADTITYRCGGDRVIARRRGDRWTTLATIEPRLAHATVIADGAVLLVATDPRVPVQTWTVRDGRVERGEIAGIDRAGALATCGGAVYGTFVRDGTSLFGRLDAGQWRFEPVAPSAAPGRLAFDEACHPFVALFDVVWSRGHHGWSSSRMPRSLELHQLAAHGSTIFASYQEIRGDGAHAGVASARLRREP